MIRTAIAVLATYLCACDFTEEVGRTMPPLEAGHLEVRWAVPIGGIEANQAREVTTTATGDVVVAGVSWTATDFTASPAVLPAQIGPQDGPLYSHAFVAQRAAADGAHVWGAMLDDGITSEIRAIAIDTDDNVVVVGQVVNAMATTPDESNTDADTIVAKFDATGTLLWRRGFGGTSLSEGRCVAIAADGTIVVSGRFSGVIDLGAGPIATADAPPPPGERFEHYVSDAFIAAFSPTGDLLWGKAFQAPQVQSINGLAVESNGDIVLHVYSQLGSTLSVGGDAFTGFAVARLTAEGTHVWTRAIESASGGWLTGQSLTVDDLGNIYVLGGESGPPEPGIVAYLLDGDGEVLETLPMAVPGIGAASGAANGMVVTIGSPPTVDGAAFVSVSDQQASPLQLVTYQPYAPPQNTLTDFGFAAVHVDASHQLALASSLTWAVDLGTGVIWPHGAGPIDDTGLSYQQGGSDALVAVYDWVED